MTTRRKLTPAEWDAALLHYAECRNYAEVARRAGVHESAVRWKVKSAGQQSAAREAMTGGKTESFEGALRAKMAQVIQAVDLCLLRLTDAGTYEGLNAEQLARALRALKDVYWGMSPGADDSARAVELPIGSVAQSFIGAYDDILAGAHTEYVFYGGRGSTKSSFVSLMIIWLLARNPTMHGVALRQGLNTLRDSVFSQLRWAISELGLDDAFKCTVSPMEITYLPTGQKIYFRGADDPNKIKSIKPAFGYIGILWFEELDQFHGERTIRKIEQSAIRGGDKAYIFKTFNPPATANNWANKYIKVPKTNQFRHMSTYLDLGSRIRWLGQAFVDEAEHLKQVNPKAYEHEYLGVPSSAGGLAFENVTLREITEAEIGTMERFYHGLDFGFYPDPAHYVRCAYDAARMTLYIIGEFRGWKLSNAELYQRIKDTGLLGAEELLICDSAEPKSVADLKSYGQYARGAEKGADSVAYSIKWLQSLAGIVIDPARAPYAAEEFAEYEYERTRDGEIISDYPDRNNHAIDAVRYALNLLWRRPGV